VGVAKDGMRITSIETFSTRDLGLIRVRTVSARLLSRANLSCFRHNVAGKVENAGRNVSPEQ
jgi:hypothetical protein